MQMLVFRHVHVNSTELLLPEVMGGVVIIIVIFIFIIKFEINVHCK
jgi:hypothetical protein